MPRFVTFFLILLQYNIRLPLPNYNVCAPKFAAGVNLRRHDTSPDPYCDVCALKYAARVNLRRRDTSMQTGECNDNISLRVKLRRHVFARSRWSRGTVIRGALVISFSECVCVLCQFLSHAFSNFQMSQSGPPKPSTCHLFKKLLSLRLGQAQEVF